MDYYINDAVMIEPLPNIIETINNLFNRMFRKNNNRTIRRTIRRGSSRVIWEREFLPDRTMIMIRTAYIPQGDRMKIIRRTFVVKPLKEGRSVIGA